MKIQADQLGLLHEIVIQINPEVDFHYVVSSTIILIFILPLNDFIHTKCYVFQ